MTAADQPTAGPAVPTRVFLAVIDEPTEFSGLGLQAPGWWVLLSQADVAAQPAPGETVTIGADTYRIKSARRGPQDAVWILGTAKE